MPLLACPAVFCRLTLAVGTRQNCFNGSSVYSSHCKGLAILHCWASQQWHPGTAVRRLALMRPRGRARLARLFAGGFELECRMLDLELFAKLLLDPLLDLCPLRQVLVVYHDMRFQCSVVFIELPNVQVVHFDHALDRFQARPPVRGCRRRPAHLP